MDEMHGYQMGCSLLTRLNGFIEVMNGLLSISNG